MKKLPARLPKLRKPPAGLLSGRLRGLTFRAKISGFLVASICLTVTLMAGIAYGLMSNTIMQQAMSMTKQQLDQNTSNLEYFIKNVEELPDTVVTDASLQEFLTTEDRYTPEYTGVVDGVYRILSNTLSANKDVLYFYVYKKLDKRFLYLGPSRAGMASDYSEAARLLESKDFTGSPIRVDFRKDPVMTDQYTVNVYQPVFNAYRIEQPVGMLCLSVTESSLAQFYTSGQAAKFPMDTFILNGKGVVVSSGDKSRISQRDPKLAGLLHRRDGSVVEDGRLVVYKYIADWDWYVVGTLPLSYLLRSNNLLLLITVCLMILVIAAAASVSAIFGRRLLRPFDELTGRMAKVSQGDMTARLNFKGYGSDFRQVSDGFNRMVEQIDSLMNHIIQEQRQLKEIEFKALQTQINPHFLYNTLDSIHWLALSAGQNEISVMVKALASFYRIALSRGRDVIPLRDELEHVSSYLTIQEIRYKDKVVSDIAVPSEFMEVMIPKMTLQPLVENAINHGLRLRPGRGLIRITAAPRGPDLLVQVSDNGEGMEKARLDALNAALNAASDSVGYGAKNVHKRIRLLFGAPYGLAYAPGESGGVTVSILLPMEQGPEPPP